MTMFHAIACTNSRKTNDDAGMSQYPSKGNTDDVVISPEVLDSEL